MRYGQYRITDHYGTELGVVFARLHPALAGFPVCLYPESLGGKVPGATAVTFVCELSEAAYDQDRKYERGVAIDLCVMPPDVAPEDFPMD